MYQSITTERAYAAAVAESSSRPVLVYKHSTQCELCTAAKKEMIRLSKDAGVPVYEVVVQTARPLSNEIERALGIRHESPQAILFVNQAAVFNTSHLGVTARKLKKAIRKAT